jgi:hypothetical protein
VSFVFAMGTLLFGWFRLERSGGDWLTPTEKYVKSFAGAEKRGRRIFQNYFTHSSDCSS